MLNGKSNHTAGKLTRLEEDPGHFSGWYHIVSDNIICLCQQHQKGADLQKCVLIMYRLSKKKQSKEKKSSKNFCPFTDRLEKH